MTYDEWLAGLKVGDEVVVERGACNTSIQKVTRLTAKRLVIGGSLRIWRATGFSLTGNEWNRACIRQLTYDNREACARAVAISTIQRALRSAVGPAHSTSTVSLLAAASCFTKGD